MAHSIAQRNPLSATERAILETSRGMVKSAVDGLGGVDPAAREWTFNRKTLAAYVDNKRRPNRQSADRLLALIAKLRGDSEGHSVDDSVPRGTAGLTPSDYWRGVLYAAGTMAETLGRLNKEAAAAPALYDQPSSRPVAVQQKVESSAAVAKAKARGAGEQGQKAKPRPRQRRA